MSPDRKRADASRNAKRLLAAARALVEESGNEVALDEVARRAGVGNATLYRHFPTRADLLAAVYADEVAALCRRADELRSELPPVEALFAWLEEFVVHVATKRPLAQAATAGPGDRRTPLFDEWHAAITAAAATLVEAAAFRPGAAAAPLARGAAAPLTPGAAAPLTPGAAAPLTPDAAAASLRPGVGAADVLALTTGAALATTDPGEARRLVGLLRTGLTGYQD
jgi:AcrR family transcriptional regulator